MIQGLLLIFGFLLFFILFIILFVVVRVMNLFHRKKYTPTDKYHNVNDDYIVIDDGEDEFLENLSTHIKYKRGDKIIPDSEGEYVDFEEINDNENKDL